jgi:glucose-1-phosphate adenylyltransferase
VRITHNVTVVESMLADGCVLEEGAVIERCVLSPGVHVGRNAVLRESIILTGTVIEEGAVVERTIADKRCRIGSHAHVGGIVQSETVNDSPDSEISITMLGKKAFVPAGQIIEPGAVIGPDVVESDFSANIVQGNENIYTKREAYEV